LGRLDVLLLALTPLHHAIPAHLLAHWFHAAASSPRARAPLVARGFWTEWRCIHGTIGRCVSCLATTVLGVE